MQLLEHIAKSVAGAAGIRVPRGGVASTPEVAARIAAEFGGRVVVKAQVPIGGRGKAGGILLVDAREAGAAAAQLLGSDVRGFAVESVLVEEAIAAAHELYLSVTIRPAQREVVLLLSAAGGVDVESQATDSMALVTIPIPTGLRPWHVWQAAGKAGIAAAVVPALIDVAQRAHELFWQQHAELVEINPLFVTTDGALVAGDVRIVPDPEAAEPPDDGLPPEQRFDFVVLNPDGNVGLVTTGAGGSMHLIDRLSEAGLVPIDFCDIRTGRPRGLAERLTAAFRQQVAMPNLSCIAINFFAGVTILDEVAPVLVDVIRAVAPPVPVVARIEGRGAEAARAMLAEIGVQCAASLDELIQMVTAVAGGSGGTGTASELPAPALTVPSAPASRAGAGGQRSEAAAVSAIGPLVLDHVEDGGSTTARRLPLSRVRPRWPTGAGGEGWTDLYQHKHGAVLAPLWSLLDGAAGGVIVQGMTGQIGRRHTARMRAYGTPIAAGVTPGRGGTEMEGIPVFNTVAEAVEATGARVSIAFLPGEVAPAGIIEAAEAGVGLIVCPTEGMRLHETLRALEAATRQGTRVIGPNTGGLLVPGRLALGFLPSDFAKPGPCAVISRSGTLSYETVYALAAQGIGVSVWIGIGGDRVKGSTFADLLPDLVADDRTGAIVLLGEIGGTDEEDAAAILAGVDILAVALLAGRTAPAGISMGHAGAIVDGVRGSYASKREALLAAGVSVAASPTEVAAILSAHLDRL